MALGEIAAVVVVETQSTATTAISAPFGPYYSLY
jgi:hypothetical protein